MRASNQVMTGQNAAETVADVATQADIDQLTRARREGLAEIENAHPGTKSICSPLTPSRRTWLRVGSAMSTYGHIHIRLG
jgi:hypothetical protein